MKNAAEKISDELRPEYDLSKLKGGVRGKYYKRATAGTTLVLLEPDVAEAFPDGRTVNEILRGVARVARTQAVVTSGLPNTYEDSPGQETKISPALKKRTPRKSANKKQRHR